MRRTWSAFAISAWLVSACGAEGASAPPPRTTTPRATVAPVASGAMVASGGDEWTKASWDDRHDTMEFVVHPTMARLFQEHGHTPAPDLTCRSCHGADAEAVSYAMPHGLPPLDPAHMPDPKADDARGRTAKFMAEQVTPKMIDLLGVAPYDPQTKRGFGCFNCHPVQK